VTRESLVWKVVSERIDFSQAAALTQAAGQASVYSRADIRVSVERSSGGATEQGVLLEAYGHGKLADRRRSRDSGD